MATISKIQRKSGVRFRAIIKQKGKVVATRTFTKKGLARTWAARIEGDRELMAAFGSRGASITFFDLCTRYMAEWSGKDYVNQTTRLTWWCKQFGNRKLIDITPDVVREGLKLRAKESKPATVARYRACLSGVFKFAIHEGWLQQNPVCKTKSPTFDNRRTRFLTDDEYGRLLSACRNSEWDRLYLLVLLGLTTGARRGEMLALKWSDIDFKRKISTLRNTKNGDNRLLPLTDTVLTELFRFRGVGSSLVFASEIKPDKPFEFRKHWHKTLESAGIENFRFHDLRHSAASYLAMNGATLHEIANVLGHRDTTVTQRYAHLCHEHKARLVERVFGDIS